MPRWMIVLAALGAGCDDAPADEIECSAAPVTAACRNDLSSRGACLDEGGCWGSWGLAAAPSCNCPTTDGGEPCTSSDECEALCVSYEASHVNSCDQPAAGTCAERRSSYGCFCTPDDQGVWIPICAD